MAFISMFIIGLFLIMGLFGAFLLLISLILFLINRHRCKKGMNPGRAMNVVKILCLICGCLNIAPFALICLFTLVGVLEEKAGDTYVGIKQAFMPEQRAVLWSDLDMEDEAEDEFEGYGQVLEYQGQEYYIIPFGVDTEKITCSDAKASLHYGERYLKKMKDEEPNDKETTMSDGILVCEVENWTDFKLICTGEYKNFVFDREVVPEQVYCRTDQYEEFLRNCTDGAEYYLGQYIFDEEMEEEIQRVTESDFRLEDLGITNEFIDALDDGQGETIEDFSGEEYELMMTSSDGIFFGICTTISKYGDNWYCYGGAFYETYSIAHNTAYINAYLLPEEGQHYMENLVGSKSYQEILKQTVESCGDYRVTKID